MKKLKHKIKLFIFNIKKYIKIVEEAKKYKKEIKEVKYLHEKKRKLTLEMLKLDRTSDNVDQHRIIKAQLNIINEIINICS